MDIDDELGGLCIAPGLHRAGYLHDPARPTDPVGDERVPPEMWRSADYHPGDVVIFGPFMPHTGLSNATEDRYRLSFDVRFYAIDRQQFLEGDLVEVGPSWVDVECGDGVTRRLQIGPETVLYSDTGEISTGADPSRWAASRSRHVIASRDGDRATYLRLGVDTPE
jgi:hypothetical protein